MILMVVHTHKIALSSQKGDFNLLIFVEILFIDSCGVFFNLLFHTHVEISGCHSS